MRTKIKHTLPDGQWLVSGGLIYRLKDGVNCDEINVTMACGSRDEVQRHSAALKVQAEIVAARDVLAEVANGNFNQADVIRRAREILAAGGAA